MAAVVGATVLGRAVVLSRCANLRGVGVIENSNLALVAFGPPQARLSPATVSSSSPSFLPRGFHSHPRMARIDSTTTGATMIANSALFRRPQLERHLNPRPWNARKLLSTSPMAVAGSGSGSGSPGPLSFFVQLIIQFLASLLPVKALVEKVEAEVDAAAAAIDEGAKIVSEIADKVESFAHAAELGAEEVERIAQKVEDVTKKIQTSVDDVADVLEGEKGTSTLLRTVEQLRNVAAAKRAQEKVFAEAELGAEEVERIAQKVEDVTKKVQTSVDDVADVLEGEKGPSTLLRTVEQLRNVASAKRAQEKVFAEAITTTEVVPDEKPETTTTTTSSEEK